MIELFIAGAATVAPAIRRERSIVEQTVKIIAGNSFAQNLSPSGFVSPRRLHAGVIEQRPAAGPFSSDQARASGLVTGDPVRMLQISFIVYFAEVEPGDETDILRVTGCDDFRDQIAAGWQELIDMMAFHLAVIPGINTTQIEDERVGSQ